MLRLINEAAVEGLTSSATPPTHEEDFLRALRHSNEVFSAFKVHSMSTKMAERLIGEDGKLRTFSEWRKAVAPIARHQVGSWLQTEYDTAILRAHQAADWLEFERNKDIFPNLRWMPTTSPAPEAAHRVFWSKPVVLPIDDPFWSEHRPGDRWNCKCSLEATDAPLEPLTQEEQKIAEDPKHAAQPGLEGDPVHKGLITDKHPYYPSSCSKCPFYKPKGLKGRLQKAFVGRVKDCHSCPYINEALEEAMKGDAGIYRIVEREEFGDRFKISDTADPSDLEDNKRVARAILRSFPDIRVRIRSHIREHEVKNPELNIDGLIADNKRIKGEEGITSGFNKAIKQGCKAVVIDLDANLGRLRINDLSKYLSRRATDFKEGRIQKCYVVYKGRAIMIESGDKGGIREALRQLQ